MDDSLIFCKANEGDCFAIKNILHKYEVAFGQSISMSKSAITSDRDFLHHTLGLATYSLQMQNIWDCHLWLVETKRCLLLLLKKKCGKSSKFWKGKLFSIGGNEVLIETMALAMSIYLMGVCQLSSLLCQSYNLW